MFPGTVKPTKLASPAHPTQTYTKAMDSPVARIKTARKDAGMDDIVEVLGELQEVGFTQSAFHSHLTVIQGHPPSHHPEVRRSEE